MRQTIAQHSDVPGYYNTRQLYDGYAGVPPKAVMCERSDAPAHEYYKDAHRTAQKRPERAHHARYASSSEALPEGWTLQLVITPPFPQSFYLAEYVRFPIVLLRAL